MSVNSSLRAGRGGTLEFARDALTAGPRAAGSRPGKIALGGLLVTGAIVATGASQTDLLLPESIRPVPGWLAGVFGTSGLGLGVVGLVVVMAVMFVAYVVAVHFAGRLSARAVLGCIAALHALVLLAPPLVSTDVFSYQAYARMLSQYGANPYLNGPHVIALDPVYPFIGAKWVTMPTTYGPVFTSLSALLAPLSIASSVIVYKAVAAVSSLVLIAVVWNLAPSRGVDPVKAAAVVGLNPLLVVYGVGGGHNDLLMLAVMMIGISLILQHRDRLGGASIVMAAGLKLTGLLVAPFALAGTSHPLSRRRRRELLVGGVAATVAVAILSVAMFGTGSLHLLGTLRRVQTLGDWHSIPGFISTRLGLGEIGHATGFILGGLFVVVVCWLLREVWRGHMDWLDGAAWATVAMLATASSLLPWYLAWLLPLAVLGRDRRLLTVAIWLTGLITFINLLGYVPHGSSVLGL
jgi:hypothetical protein